MNKLCGHSFFSDVFADGRAAQQHGEARTAIPQIIAALAAERWQAGWDAGEVAETQTSDLLMDMPSLGDWMLGAGTHSDLLTELLDANTTLIEEEEQAENDGDLLPWRVRLTEWGMTRRAQVLAARDLSEDRDKP